jgi:hypothetical protein
MIIPMQRNGRTNEVAQGRDIILHPTDAEASHTLNRFDPKFARDHRSVHLHLLIDDFQPYNSNSTVYSC